MDKPKDEPEMIQANACKQCGFDLRLPPECTLEVWEQLHDERDQARAERDRLAARVAELERLCNGELELREHVEAERDRLRRALDEGGGT